MDSPQEKLVEWFKKHFYSLKTYYDHDDARATHVASTLMQAVAEELLASPLLDQSYKPCLVEAKDAVARMNLGTLTLPKDIIPPDEFEVMKDLPLTWSVETFSDSGNDMLIEVLKASKNLNSITSTERTDKD
ncbi:unnamed protein product [Orchesella dallaii]|uniref:Uncharacterized protein n=1 Tax=Orchesella dallaii TaxID=48710 RepID=A0ABP1QUU8_9HEXA